MMVTAPKHYCCRPNIGYVRPGDTVELQVMVEPMKDEKKIEQERHKFMIQSMYVKDAPGDLKSQASQVDEPEAPIKELAPPADFWAKDHSKKDIMFHKFTVAFHQQTMTKDKLDGILMDLTSRAAAEAAAEMERERRRE
uniref:Major sperm protein n=1 Tax=Panagrolaimus sp. ES5 TaxID=591445 RepID=A0AC34GLM5_9BILA